MDVGLVIEAQHGLTWERWTKVLALVEQLGFPSLFRSDHFFVGSPEPTIDAYLSFVLAATQTKHLRFGSLVTPIMFRPPAELGRLAAQIDQLSGGRFVLGLGVGWFEAEHSAFGIPYPPLPERFDRLDEAARLLRALWTRRRQTSQGSSTS